MGIYLYYGNEKREGNCFFEGKNIRREWNSEKELWYFSVVDVVGVLADSIDPRKYWNKLAERLRKEGSESVTKCHQLKMLSSDGKKYLTDVADTETLFRLIQSIPSPNAEPFKLWLARVGYERLEETADPELEITKAWTDLTVKQYKNLKGLKKENLRDNMSSMELVLNMLAETAVTEISKVKIPDGLAENKKVAREGGSVAGNARKEIETRTGKKVVTDKNAKQLRFTGKFNSFEIEKT